MFSSQLSEERVIAPWQESPRSGLCLLGCVTQIRPRGEVQQGLFYGCHPALNQLGPLSLQVQSAYIPAYEEHLGLPVDQAQGTPVSADRDDRHSGCTRERAMDSGSTQAHQSCAVYPGAGHGDPQCDRLEFR